MMKLQDVLLKAMAKKITWWQAGKRGQHCQELRLAGITTVEQANAFLNGRYIGEFNAKFTVAAPEKGTAFRKTSRTALHWVFTIQTERVVDQDNTVKVGPRVWQLEKSRFRHSLAGTTVTIHEHLDGSVSIRLGPHVVGRYRAHGEPEGKATKRGQGCGNDGPAGAVDDRHRRAVADLQVLLTDADRSCVNKSGQIDILTTVPQPR